MSRPRRRGIAKPGRRAHSWQWTDPNGLTAHAARYLSWLSVRGYAESAMKSRRCNLAGFCSFCEERGITYPVELTRTVIELYQRHIAGRHTREGRPLDPRTQALKLSQAGGFCTWLVKEGLITANPAAEIELPRRGIKLPRTIFTVEEVERILAVPDVRSALGLRDRAILETLYSTGVRRAELCCLLLVDLDSTRGVLAVRQGKGRKDRFVPIGARALAWVERYRDDVRPHLAHADDDGFLFLGREGDPLTPDALGNLVGEIITKADIGKKASCHAFRHTMATLMLEGGADVRFIQAILGHANLDTTQIYTHVSIGALKAVHEATHPAARLRRRQPAAVASASTESAPELQGEASEDAEEHADSELLSSLEAEK